MSRKLVVTCDMCDAEEKFYQDKFPFRGSFFPQIPTKYSWIIIPTNNTDNWHEHEKDIGIVHFLNEHACSEKCLADWVKRDWQKRVILDYSNTLDNESGITGAYIYKTIGDKLLLNLERYFYDLSQNKIISSLKNNENHYPTLRNPDLKQLKEIHKREKEKKRILYLAPIDDLSVPEYENLYKSKIISDLEKINNFIDFTKEELVILLCSNHDDYFDFTTILKIEEKFKNIFTSELKGKTSVLTANYFCDNLSINYSHKLMDNLESFFEPNLVFATKNLELLSEICSMKVGTKEIVILK